MSPKQLIFSLALLAMLSGCNGKPLDELDPGTDHVVAAELKQPTGLAVMSESGTTYCLWGKVTYFGHVLKAGQAFKNKLYRYNIKNLVDHMPQYATNPLVQVAIRAQAGK